MKKIIQITLSCLLILSLVQIHNCLNFDNFLTLNAAGGPPPPPIGGISTNTEDLAKIIEPWDQKKAKAFTDCLTKIIAQWDSLKTKETIKETIKQEAFKSAWESLSVLAKKQLLASINKMKNDELKNIFTDQGLIAASVKEAPEKQDIMAQEISDLISALWKYTEALDNKNTLGQMTKSTISNQFLKKFPYNKDNPQGQWEKIPNEIEINENLAIIVALTLASNFVNLVSDKAKENTDTLKGCIKKINIKLESFGLDDNFLSYSTKKEDIFLETGDLRSIDIIDQFNVKNIDTLIVLFRTKYPKQASKPVPGQAKPGSKKTANLVSLPNKKNLDTLITAIKKTLDNSEIAAINQDIIDKQKDCSYITTNLMVLDQEKINALKDFVDFITGNMQNINKILAEINTTNPTNIPNLHFIFDLIQTLEDSTLKRIHASSDALGRSLVNTKSKIKTNHLVEKLYNFMHPKISKSAPKHTAPPSTLKKNLTKLIDDLIKVKENLNTLSGNVTSLKKKL